MAEQGYTLREAATELGVSVPWLRKQIRAGKLTPGKVIGKWGEEYRLTPADLSRAQALYPSRSLATRDTRLARAEEQYAANAQLVAALAAAEAVAAERADSLTRERERADRLEAELKAERERREALQTMSVWDRLRGRHRDV